MTRPNEISQPSALMNRLIALAATTLVLGCSATQYTQTGGGRSPRTADCSFETYMSPPTRAFVELGVVEFYTPGGGSAGWADSVAEARSRAAEYVCQAGGDAIVLTSHSGAFTSATVIAYKQ